MSTKRLAIRGVAFNWLGQVCSIVIIFFLTPFLVHTLGNEAYGIWSIVMGLTGYYALADAGLRGTATKYVAQYEATGDHSKTRQVISTLVGCYAVLALIAMAAAAGVAWLFPSLFETAGESVNTIRMVVIITAGSFAIKLIGKPFGAALTAMTRFDVTNALGIGSQLLQALLMVLVLVAGGGLLGMAWVTLGVGILTQLVQYRLATRVLGSPLVSPAFFDRSMVKELVFFSSGLFVVNGSQRVRNASGVIIVGALAGPAAAAFFSIGASLIQKSRALLRGVISVVLPVASQLNAQKRNKDLVQIVVLVPRLVIALSLAMTVIFFVNGQVLIDLWIGDGYSVHVYPILCILALALVARSVPGGHPSILVAMGRIRFLGWLFLGDALLTIALGAYLVFTFGIIGMGLAILAVQVIAHGVLLPIYTCRLVEYPWTRFLVRTLLPSVLAGLPVLAVALAIKRVFPASNLWVLVGEMLVLVLLAALSTFLVCLPAHIRVAVLHAIFRRARAPSTSTTQIGDGGFELTGSTRNRGGLSDT